MSRTRAPVPTSLNEALPHLPPGWARIRLGEVADMQPGFAFKSKWFQSTGIRLLRGINISPEGARWEDVVFLEPDRARGFDDYVLQPGDVVIAMDRPVISSGIKVARLGVQDTPSLLVQRVGRFRPTSLIMPGIVFAFLRSTTFLQHIGAHSTGTQIPHISASDIKSVPLALPPVNEQRRIVAKIDALQDRSRRAREALEAIPALLDRFRQSVLAAAFRGDLTAQWRAEHPEVEPAPVLLQRIRAERKARWIEAQAEKARARAEAKTTKAGKPWTAKEDAATLKRERAKATTKYTEPEPVDPVKEGLPELPEGWCWCAAEELTPITRPIIYGIIKGGPHIADGTPMVRVKDITSGTLDPDDIKRCDPDRARKFSRATLAEGDVLISKDGTIGKTAIVPEWLAGGNISQHVLRFSPAGGVSPLFLALAIESPDCQDWISEKIQGVALQGINVGDFRRLPIPLAGTQAQHKLIEAHRAYTDGIARLVSTQDALASLNALDQSILAKAFRGELVPQDPNDEPASELLKRIQAERAAAEAAKPKRGRKKKSASKKVPAKSTKKTAKKTSARAESTAKKQSASKTAKASEKSVSTKSASKKSTSKKKTTAKRR